jgi:hypothetical protein
MAPEEGIVVTQSFLSYNTHLQEEEEEEEEDT